MRQRRRIDGILTPLVRPGAFPDVPLAQPRGFVAQHRQEGDGLGRDELGHERLDVEPRMAAVQFRHLHEICIAVCCLPACVWSGGRAQASICHFQPIEQPVLEGPLFLFFPGLGIPAALVFGAFDEGNVVVALDRGDATLDQRL